MEGKGGSRSKRSVVLYLVFGIMTNRYEYKRQRKVVIGSRDGGISNDRSKMKQVIVGAECRHKCRRS